MLVHDLGLREAVTIEPSACAREAAMRMEQQSVSSLVVADDERRVAGIVTDRDLVRRVMARGADPAEVTVASIMTRDPVTVRNDVSVHEAVRRMRNNGVRRLPVVDDDERVIGLINLRSVLGSMANDIRDVSSLMSGDSGFWES